MREARQTAIIGLCQTAAQSLVCAFISYAMVCFPCREPLREYLLGIASFPSNVITIISVYEEEEFVPSMFPPSAGTPRREEGRPYSFLIPGIEFSMALGKRLKTESRELSSHLQPERRIFMSPLVNLGVKSVYDKLKEKQLHSQSIHKKSSRE
jgi:hypothetical protein